MINHSTQHKSIKKSHEVFELFLYTLRYKLSQESLALVIGMKPWRDQIPNWILESKFIQIGRHFNSRYFNWVIRPFLHQVNPTIYIWGYKAPQFFIDYIRQHNFNVFFLEDGFIRSAPEDDKTVPPLSIVMDSQAPYFDTTRPNDLTDLIANYDFQSTNFNVTIAREMLDYFVAHRVSKYNHQDYIDVHPIYGKKTKYRILILGQVPHDDSLKYGDGSDISLLNTVQQAINDFPTAQIIVKPHPMNLSDKSILNVLEELDCLVLEQPLHLVDALESIDHVYTITSLAGFEALVRGKKVTALGQPFYKGWQLTDNEEILRPLTIEQLFWIIFYSYVILLE